MLQHLIMTKRIVLILVVFTMIILVGCDWMGRTFLGHHQMPNFRVKIERGTNDNNIVFKIDTKYEFGENPFYFIGRFSVYKEYTPMWILQSGRSTKKIDTIIYGVNPAPGFFEEITPPKSLKKNVLYSCGTYFKIIDDPKYGVVILQGDSPDNLKDKEQHEANDKPD